MMDVLVDTSPALGEESMCLSVYPNLDSSNQKLVGEMRSVLVSFGRVMHVLADTFFVSAVGERKHVSILHVPDAQFT